MPKYYLEEDGVPVLFTETEPGVIDADKAAKWFYEYEKSDNVVKHDKITAKALVSTTFLGVSSDLSLTNLYETRIFSDDENFSAEVRYARTRKEALKVHANFVKRVRTTEGLEGIEAVKRKLRNASWNF